MSAKKKGKTYDTQRDTQTQRPQPAHHVVGAGHPRRGLPVRHWLRHVVPSFNL